MARWSGPVDALPAPVRSAFRSSLDGASLAPGEPGYQDACRLWNGAVDRRPGLVVRVASVRDVQRCLDLVTGRDLALAVRAGGHGVAGDALCDGGLVIDVSAMKQVEVDPRTRTVVAGAGLT